IQSVSRLRRLVRLDIRLAFWPYRKALMPHRNRIAMNRYVVLLFPALFSLCIATSAHAAEVRKITKKSVVVGGVTADDGLTKGATACFYNGDTEVGCGEDARVGKTGKIVFVNAKPTVKRKLKKGFEVRASG